jgi:hypothetical protein
VETKDRHEPERRAEKLTDRFNKIDREHEGNRAFADENAPQPTREATRDRSK